MSDRYRSALPTIALVLLAFSPGTLSAQYAGLSDLFPPISASGANQHVMRGKLELRPRGYVLVGDDGRAAAYLIPRKSLDLTSFIGQRVDATVREPSVRAGAEPRFWLDQIALSHAPAGGATRSIFDPAVPGRIALAQYTEPAGLPPSPDVLTSVTDALVPESWGPASWVWGSAEYLYWWPDGMYIPALVTTSPVGTSLEQAGVLGEPGTSILYGDQDIVSSGRHGLRFRGGVWLDAKNRYAIQGEYFALETGGQDYSASCDAAGFPILARPYFNINPRDLLTLAFDPPAREDSLLVCYPATVRGSISVDTSSQLQSAGLAYGELMAGETFSGPTGNGFSRVDAIVGYRFMRLNEHLAITQSYGTSNAEIPVMFQSRDQFDTQNQFHGVDVGMRWQAGWNRWSVDLLVKSALGNVRQQVQIGGQSTATIPGAAPVVYEGGLLALPSNIGEYSRGHFSIIPELGLTLGYALLPKLRATIGYSLVYWGTVVRPGDQIDMDVNPDQIVQFVVPPSGAPRPAFTFRETDYWVHGANIGLEGRW